jgi:DNA-binding PadR family transcriptional regulator
MATKGGYQNRIEILQGTLDMLILKTLQWGEQHGYGISQALRATSGDVLQVETGSLYPALHRMERQGWVKASGRRARAINGRSSTKLRNWAKSSSLRTMSVGERWSRQSKEL